MKMKSVTAVVQANDGRTVLHGHIHDLADFLGVGFRKRSPEHRKVLAEDVNHAPIDGAPSRDNPVACRLALFHAEVCRAVPHEHVEFFERSLIEQKLYALPRCQFALGVLRIDASLSAACTSISAPTLEFCENIRHGVVPF